MPVLAMQDITILTGDIVKFALGIVSILYCLILAGQHYFMYRTPAEKLGRIEEGEPGGESELVKSFLFLLVIQYAISHETFSARLWCLSHFPWVT